MGLEAGVDHLGHVVGDAVRELVRPVHDLREPLGERPRVVGRVVEGLEAGDRLEQGRAQTPDVTGEARYAGSGWVALLWRHVGVGADRVIERLRLLDGTRDTEVDEPRGSAHDDVARLDVEVDVADPAQVVQGRGDLDRQWQVLLLRQRPVTADQRGDPGTVEVLEHQVRPVPGRLGAETAHHHGVVDVGEGVDLPPKSPEGLLVLDLSRPHHLDHDRPVGDVVEGEVGLVGRPSPEQLHGCQVGRDRVVPPDPQESRSLPMSVSSSSYVSDACRCASGRWCGSRSSRGCGCRPGGRRR